MRYPPDRISILGQSDYEVIVEQPQWWASDAADAIRGELAWTPTSPDSNQWHCWRLWRNSSYSTDGINCRALYGSYLFRCYQGSYFGPSTDHYDFPGGTWMPNSNSSGWCGIYSNSETRPLVLNVPAGTRRLYMLVAYSTDDRYCTLSLTGPGQLQYTRFNIGTGCVGGSDIPSDSKYATDFASWALVATDCGGGTFTLTPNSSGSTIVCGFIAVSDIPSNPHDGVMDPGTMTEITPTHQYAPGPLAYQIGASGEAMIIGQGHWSATRKLVNYSHTVQYESGNSFVDWQPATRTHVKVATTQFVRNLVGDISIDDPSLGIIGAENAIMRFTSAGFDYDLQTQFNSTAQACDLRLSTTYMGGYCGQWGLNRRFINGMDLPSIGQTRVASGSGDWAFDRGGGTLVAQTDKYSAIYFASPRSRLASGGILPAGRSDIMDRDDQGTFMKFYTPCTTDGYAIQAGDMVGGVSRRMLVQRNVL